MGVAWTNDGMAGISTVAVRRNYFVFLFLSAIGSLATATLGLATATWLNLPHASWWRTLTNMALATTTRKWMELIIWALLTGALFAIAPRVKSVRPVLAVCALIMGALIPVGLILVGGALNQIWPGTTGPADKPQLTVILVAYSLLCPWLSGTVLAHFPGETCPK
jgi:hypothetical protein